MLCWLGVVIALDSTSVSYARIEGMLDDVNIQPRQYSIAILLYFVAYIVADVPANILLLRTRPRGFLSTIVLLCGKPSLDTDPENAAYMLPRSCHDLRRLHGELCWLSSVSNHLRSFSGSFLRWLDSAYCILLSGVCTPLPHELFPGLSFACECVERSKYLCTQHCRYSNAKRVQLLAYGTEEMDGIAGYSAWRWLFIIEGGVTGVSAGLAFLALPPWPENATFLSPKEKGSLPNAGGSTFGPARWKAEIGVALKQVFKDPKVYFW